MTLNGKNVLITGASRGLGLEIVREMWNEGANLLLTARSENLLEDIKQQFAQEADTGQNIDYIAVDLNENDAVSKIEKHARKIWSKLDVLINNAGIQGPIGKVWENDWEEWTRTFQVNFFSVVNLSRTLIPWMAETGGGKIINLSGGGATGPRPNFSAYALSKTGIVRFTEILAHETAGMNILVNCIAPGALGTDMMREVFGAGAETAGEKEFNTAEKLINQESLNAEKAVELCVFLASEKSGEMSGRLISALWDPWKDLPGHSEELKNSDIYTLRRIIPGDRGKNWK